MDEFGDRNVYKTIVKHFEKYLNLLTSKQIKLMAVLQILLCNTQLVQTK